jgi:glutamyl-tRNA reductase
MDFFVLGLNHITAPIEEREKCAFSDFESDNFLKQVQKIEKFRECVILSTCNRVEIYGVYDGIKNGEGEEFLRNFISEFKNVEIFKNKNRTYFYTELSAVKHLFKIASGLDSQIIGEPQILGQVKDSYFRSFEAKMTDVVINKLFHFAFHVGKRVRTETEIGNGSYSIGSVAVQTVSRLIDEKLSNKVAFLIGTGEIGELIAKHLHENQIRKLYITSRTFENAVKVADELGGTAIQFGEMKNFIFESDILISATGASDFIITYNSLQPVMQKRADRRLILIDVSVPRNIEPSIKNIDNTILLDIDDLSNTNHKFIEERKTEIPKAEAIIEEVLKEVKEWKEIFKVSNVIRLLQQRFNESKIQVLEKYRKNFNEKDWEKLDILANSLISKILHTPMNKIKEYSQEPHIGSSKIETIFEIFELNKILEKEKD